MQPVTGTSGRVRQHNDQES